MKILYLVTNFDLIGGKEGYDRSLLQALNDFGEKVSIVKLGGVSVFQKIYFVSKALILSFLKRPDVIFCSHISFSPIVYVLSRFLRISYIVFTHGIEVWNIKKEIYKKALQIARLVVTVSRYTALKLREQIPALSKNTFLLKNVADGERFSIKEKPNYLIKRHNLTGAKIFLTVTHLYPTEESKGYLRVIDALSPVQKLFPEARYVIVGAGTKGFGDNRERIRIYAEERGLSNSVILAGNIPDEEIGDYYNLCDLFIMPSSQEGFGVVFLEALASGKPVIAGNIDGSRDAVLGGELGLLVDPENNNEIAQAIIQVLTGKAPKRFYDREYLRRRVLEVYGYNKFKGRIADLLKSLSYGL